MCEKNSESKLVRALRQVMEDECEMYRIKAEQSEHVFSERFEKKMQKLIRRTKKPYYPLVNTGFKRVACVMIAIMTCFGGLMNVEAVRESFKNLMLFTNDDDMTKIHVNGNAGFPTTIEEIYVITYSLIGYDLMSEMYEDTMVRKDYKNSFGDVIFFKQITHNYFKEFWWDTEGDIISNADINGNEAICFSAQNGINTVMWDNGVYVFTISTSLPMEEAIEIAKSVKGGGTNAQKNIYSNSYAYDYGYAA